jgi:hypothetical protein
MKNPLASFEENLESILALPEDVQAKSLVACTLEINYLYGKYREAAFDLMKDACRALRSKANQDMVLLALAQASEEFANHSRQACAENSKVTLDFTKDESKTDCANVNRNPLLTSILNQVEHLPSKVAFTSLKDRYKTLLLSDADKLVILTAMARLLPNRTDFYFHKTGFNFLKDECNALRADAKVVILTAIVKNVSSDLAFKFIKEECQALRSHADKVVLLTAIINRKDYLCYHMAFDFIKDQYYVLCSKADKLTLLTVLSDCLAQSYRLSQEDIQAILNFIKDAGTALCADIDNIEVFSAVTLENIIGFINNVFGKPSATNQIVFDFIKDASQALRSDADKSQVLVAVACKIHYLPKENKRAAFEFIVAACIQLHPKYQSKVLQALARQIARLAYGYKQNHEYKKEAFYCIANLYAKLALRYQRSSVLKALARQVRYLPEADIQAAENRISAMMFKQNVETALA